MTLKEKEEATALLRKLVDERILAAFQTPASPGEARSVLAKLVDERVGVILGEQGLDLVGKVQRLEDAEIIEEDEEEEDAAEEVEEDVADSP